MGTLGPLAGGTFATDSSVGAVAWTAASNAQSSDNSYATSVLLLSQITNYLMTTNFGFNIPLDAIITGVTVSVERSTTTLNGTHDNSVKLVKATVISGNDKASATLWPTADAVATYGSSSDLWGLSLTPSDINNSGFGVVISGVADLAGTAQIDYMSITIDYLGSNRYGQAGHMVRTGDGMSVSEVAN